MSFDGIVVRSLVHELQTCVGGRINKIHQPTDQDLIFQIRAGGSNYKLLLSANPTYPRFSLTGANYPNPLEAPMFCMLLRKHCENGIIEAIEQEGMERIIHFHIRQRDELGDISQKTIIVEIMGRHSNIILVDPATQTILDSIHHVTPAISSYRIVMPGSKYVAPPQQHKLNPLKVTKEQFLAAMQEQAEAGGETFEQRLVGAFSGISPLAAKEIVFRSEASRADSGDKALSQLWNTFAELAGTWNRDLYTPVIREQETNGKTYFSVFDLTHISGEAQYFTSPSECVEAYYGDKAERDTIKQRVSDLLKLLQNEKNKNEKKLDKLHDTLEEAKDADKYRIQGELLTASMHLFQKGSTSVEVVNYYDEAQNTVSIALDPLLTPSENAQRYFRKYTKSKNSLIAVQEQLASTHEEIRYLESLQQQLETASLGDIEEIRDELVEQGYVRDRNKKARRKKKPSKPLLACYTSSEGIPIYVGKNNTQNEYLTNRLAQSGDTWLHTKDIPGSHVVIRAHQFSDATLNEAAQLAASFSQARSSSQVPVDYTLIRHVRKPSGAKPGFVIYDHQKTLFITPDEPLIKSLPVSVK
ncbi:Rqc2 family fibronectin-binding protein [Paenibacillus thalictri]|uniref:Rqc2 homolog RqcH n=1 Tax=Paenibacillus thalictri TaxID=2527873 RepID=A0A4Q9DT90_9BACL|nr:NFACT RNA binding domain-containing protein [Paenibacillus thalictri]TBL78324.1 fibronectin/fibrinogen-binding protein [Paenibacillus thalictri]